MKFLVFGSLNIDKVYSLAHLPEKGETLYCKQYELHVGGKGLNQAVSLTKAGADVYMAGYIGQDGNMLRDHLERSGVNTDFIRQTDGFTGHAVIEVDSDGQNQMILYAGANHDMTEEYCREVLNAFAPGDVLLVQYETVMVEYMLKEAHKKGLITAFNPSPFVPGLCTFDYSDVDYLILNETEAEGITGLSEPEKAAEKLMAQKRSGAVIITLGGKGVLCADRGGTWRVPAFRVEAVDTTGAGDTFTGYVLYAILNGEEIPAALRRACAASAIAVTKYGAAETIPERQDVNAFLSINT